MRILAALQYLPDERRGLRLIPGGRLQAIEITAARQTLSVELHAVHPRLLETINEPDDFTVGITDGILNLVKAGSESVSSPDGQLLRISHQANW